MSIGFENDYGMSMCLNKINAVLPTKKKKNEKGNTMKYAKLSDYKIKKILKLFCVDITSNKSAKLLNINRKTIDHYYHQFRAMINLKSNFDFTLFSEQVEIDVLGICPISDHIILGMVGSNKKIFIARIPKNDQVALQEIIQKHVMRGTTIFSGDHLHCENLSYLGYKHCEVGNKEAEFLFNKKCSLNNIHYFAGYCKRRLAKFNGKGQRNYHFYFRECAFRLERTTDQLYNEMTYLLRFSGVKTTLPSTNKMQNFTHHHRIRHSRNSVSQPSL